MIVQVCFWALPPMALAQSALTEINGWVATLIQYHCRARLDAAGDAADQLDGKAG